MTPTIPAFLWFQWACQLLLQIPLRLVCWTLAPVVVWSQKSPETTPDWAAFIVPFDHAIAGEHADPMWIRWWETDLDRVEADGTRRNDRAWYCQLLRLFGIRDTRHWLVRLFQLLRNGGAGGNYGWFGADVRDTLMFHFDLENGGKLTLAYHQNDTFFGDTGLEIAPDAVPEAFYLRVGARRFGWKLNYKVHGLCKWMLR